MEMAVEGMIDMTVDLIIEETIIDRTEEIKGTGIKGQVKTTAGLSQDIEVTQR